MRNSLRMIQYTLYALLIFSLSGCGATKTSPAGSDKAPGKITANLVLPKSSGKSVALQADVTRIRLTVTGAAIPTARQDIASPAGAVTSGTVEVYPGSDLIVTAQSFNAAGVVLYEGFVPGVTVVSGVTPTNVTITLNAPIVKAGDATCLGCHESTRDKTGQNLIADFKQSGHYTNESADPLVVFPLNGSTQPGCAGCHGTSHNDLNPSASGRCATCHGAVTLAPGGKHATNYAFNGTTVVTNSCNTCHQSHNTNLSCVTCHSVGQNATALRTGGPTNDGVRAITGEFAKRSHHVSGRAAKDSDCAACHLEGERNGTVVGVDIANHGNAGVINLRNGNIALVGNQTTAVGAGYPWDPAAPNHTLLDQFCFSCHNAAGAPDAVAALTGVAGYTGTALNPFGDSVSNAYDQVSRVNVVGVYEKFDTGNSSHHAVRGQRYTASTLNAAQFSNISTANFNFQVNGVPAPIRGTTGTISATNLTKLTGTMFETGKFTPTYTTLNNVVLADNVTLHCGDCHTVGQFRAADVNTAVGSFNKAVIGAHGSNNEYLLRNSNGDDTFARDALVCFICHKENLYSNPGQTADFNAPDIQAHNSVNNSFVDCNGNNENSSGLIGAARLVPDERQIDDATFQAELAAGTYQPTGGGNIFGIKCMNCHNASDKKTFGGIHGNAGNASYTSYSGAKNPAGVVTTVSRKPYRFMPGLGNFRYNGGDSDDQWTVRTLSQANKQGCYTLNGASTATRTVLNGTIVAAGTAGGVLTRVPNPSPTNAVASGANTGGYNPTTGIMGPNGAPGNDNGILGSWGACTDHAGTSVFGGRATTRTLLRPLTY